MKRYEKFVIDDVVYYIKPDLLPTILSRALGARQVLALDMIRFSDIVINKQTNEILKLRYPIEEVIDGFADL